MARAGSFDDFADSWLQRRSGRRDLPQLGRAAARYRTGVGASTNIGAPPAARADTGADGVAGRSPRSRSPPPHAGSDDHWSYQLLDARLQRLFRRVSAFRGGFTTDAATVVCADRNDPDDIADDLDALVSRSLLTVDRLTRGIGFGSSTRSPRSPPNTSPAADEVDMIRRRHLQHMIDWSRATRKELEGPNPAPALAELGSAEANIRAAYQTCSRCRRPQLARRHRRGSRTVWTRDVRHRSGSRRMDREGSRREGCLATATVGRATARPVVPQRCRGKAGRNGNRGDSTRRRLRRRRRPGVRTGLLVLRPASRRRCTSATGDESRRGCRSTGLCGLGHAQVYLNSAAPPPSTPTRAADLLDRILADGSQQYGFLEGNLLYQRARHSLVDRRPDDRRRTVRGSHDRSPPDGIALAVSYALFGLAELARTRGDLDQARRAYEQALEIDRRTSRREEFMTGRTRQDLRLARRSAERTGTPQSPGDVVQEDQQPAGRRSLSPRAGSDRGSRRPPHRGGHRTGLCGRPVRRASHRFMVGRRRRDLTARPVSRPTPGDACSKRPPGCEPARGASRMLWSSFTRRLGSDDCRHELRAGSSRPGGHSVWVVMATAGRWRGVAAFVVGGVVAWLAAEGHRVAADAAPSTSAVAVAAVLVATLAIVGSRLSWSWWRVVAAISLLQPVMHVLFSTVSTDAASHLHHHHEGSATAGGWGMVAAHVVATVAAAVLLRVGGRWLVGMPECVRAIGLFVRRPAVWPYAAPGAHADGDRPGGRLHPRGREQSWSAAVTAHRTLARATVSRRGELFRLGSRGEGNF